MDKTIFAIDGATHRLFTMIVGARIAERLDFAEMAQAELARRVGLDQSTINALVKGNSKSTRHLRKIAIALRTTEEYLTGESDEPFRHIVHLKLTADQEEWLALLEQASSSDRSMVRDIIKARRAERELIPQPMSPADDDRAQVESVDLAYGMGGTFIDDNQVETEKLTFSLSWLRNFTHTSPDLLFVARGAGDSMNPTIHDSDIVLVDRSQTRPQMRDQIWAMTMAGMGMIKRLRPMPDGTMLIMSDNAAVSDDRATDGELFIIGRVVAIVRKV